MQAILEATMREKMRFERSWIMRASKGAQTLADVQRNVQRLMTKAKGLHADVYYTLDHYFDIVVPQIARLPSTTTMTLKPGLNVMDLTGYTMELQSLVIRSVIEWVYETASNIVVLIPEAWEFIPQARGSPCLLACEQLIRKGGAGGNHVWLDSQDIAGDSQERAALGRRLDSRRAARGQRGQAHARAHPRQEAENRRRDAA